MTPHTTQAAPLAELSDAELDAVGGGETLVFGGLANVFAQVALNVAALNVVGGDQTQTTGAQTITIGG